MHAWIDVCWLVGLAHAQLACISLCTHNDHHLSAARMGCAKRVHAYAGCDLSNAGPWRWLQHAGVVAAVNCRPVLCCCCLQRPLMTTTVTSMLTPCWAPSLEVSTHLSIFSSKECESSSQRLAGPLSISRVGAVHRRQLSCMFAGCRVCQCGDCWAVRALECSCRRLRTPQQHPWYNMRLYACIGVSRRWGRERMPLLCLLLQASTWWCCGSMSATSSTRCAASAG
jgi:hypothetical protein